MRSKGLEPLDGVLAEVTCQLCRRRAEADDLTAADDAAARDHRGPDGVPTADPAIARADDAPSGGTEQPEQPEQPDKPADPAKSDRRATSSEPAPEAVAPRPTETARARPGQEQFVALVFAVIVALTLLWFVNRRRR